MRDENASYFLLLLVLPHLHALNPVVADVELHQRLELRDISQGGEAIILDRELGQVRQRTYALHLMQHEIRPSR